MGRTRTLRTAVSLALGAALVVPGAASTALAKEPELLVVVDRLAVDGGDAARQRLPEALATAFLEGEGIAIVVHQGARGGPRRRERRRPRAKRCLRADRPALRRLPAAATRHHAHHPQRRRTHRDAHRVILLAASR